MPMLFYIFRQLQICEFCSLAEDYLNKTMKHWAQFFWKIIYLPLFAIYYSSNEDLGEDVTIRPYDKVDLLKNDNT